MDAPEEAAAAPPLDTAKVKQARKLLADAQAASTLQRHGRPRSSKEAHGFSVQRSAQALADAVDQALTLLDEAGVT